MFNIYKMLFLASSNIQMDKITLHKIPTIWWKKISSSKISYYSPPPTSPPHTRGDFPPYFLLLFGKQGPRWSQILTGPRDLYVYLSLLKQGQMILFLCCQKNLNARSPAWWFKDNTKLHGKQKDSLKTLPGFKQVISHNFAIPVIILHWCNFTDQDLNWQFAIRICNHF